MLNVKRKNGILEPLLGLLAASQKGCGKNPTRMPFLAAAGGGVKNGLKIMDTGDGRCKSRANPCYRRRGCGLQAIL